MIDTNDIEGIVMITDGENCLNLLQHKDHTNDEMMMRMLKNIEIKYDTIGGDWEGQDIYGYIKCIPMIHLK